MQGFFDRCQSRAKPKIQVPPRRLYRMRRKSSAVKGEAAQRCDSTLDGTGDYRPDNSAAGSRPQVSDPLISLIFILFLQIR